MQRGTVRQALSLTYGHFFAEFLGELSLVRLRLLDETTCVGLRYEQNVFNFRSFSRKAAFLNFPRLLSEFSLCLESPLKRGLRICLETVLTRERQIQ